MCMLVFRQLDMEKIFIRHMMECSVASTTSVGRPIVTGYIYEVKCAKAIEQIPNDSSASVYKADAFDPAKPEYRVRYWDKEGNYTDTNVQINGVNPRNASYLEMLAYIRIQQRQHFLQKDFVKLVRQQLVHSVLLLTNRRWIIHRKSRNTQLQRRCLHL